MLKIFAYLDLCNQYNAQSENGGVFTRLWSIKSPTSTRVVLLHNPCTVNFLKFQALNAAKKT